MALKLHSKNMIFAFGGDLAGRTLGFFAAAYLARVLGKEGFGAISIALAVLGYALLIGSSGLALLGVRRAAHPRIQPSALAREISLARLALSFFALLVVGAVVWMIYSDPAIRQLTLTYLLYLFPAAMMLEWLFQGRQRIEIAAGGRIIGAAVYLMWVIAFVRTPDQIIHTAWGWTAGGSASALFFWWILVRQFPGDDQPFPTPGTLWRLIKDALPLGTASIISQVVLQFPFLYLGWKTSQGQVGLFSAAFKLTGLLLIFDRVFYTVFYPVISKTASEAPERLGPIINRVLKAVVVLAWTIGLLAIAGADTAIHIVFGTEFTGAAPLFRALIFYFLLTLTKSVIGFTLVGMGKDRLFTRAIVSGMIVFFLLLAAAPDHSPSLYIIFALLAYQLTALMLMIHQLRREISLRWIRGLAAPYLTGLLATWLLFGLQLSWFFNILGVIFIAVPALMLAAGLGRDDWKYFKKVFL